MRNWLLTAGLLAGIALGPAHAQVFKSPVGHEVARTAADISNAFSRREAQFVPGSLDQAVLPVTAADLFPGYGFAPRANQVSWTLRAVSTDVVTLCTVTRVANAEEWAGFIHASTKAGLVPTTTDCQAGEAWGTPTQFPLQIGARRDLDRRQVPLPTVVPEGLNVAAQVAATWYPVVSSPVAVNAILQAHPGQPSSVWRLKVTNTSAETLRFGSGLGTPGMSVGTEDEGCAAMTAGSACYLDVTYTPTLTQASSVGRVRFVFKSIDINGQDLGPQVEASLTIFGETLQ